MSVTKFFHGFTSDRTALSLLFAAVVLAFLGWCTDEPLDLESDENFWFDKLCWREDTDLLILGDSRSLMGLSPTVMAVDLPGVRIRNFGFSGVPYTPEYLNAAERAWDWKSGERAVLIGVTPQSLRNRPQENQFSRSMATLTPISRWMATWTGWAKRRWPPLTRVVFERVVLGQTVDCFRTRHHPDGWVEPLVHGVTLKPQFEDYREIQKYPISEEFTQTLLDRVRTWTDRGIRVYGFRPPTCPQMEAVENDFDEGQFVNDFVSAGGVWLEPSQQDLKTIDGSHLDTSSANLFSTRIAKDLAAIRSRRIAMSR